MNKTKLIRITTIPESLRGLLKGQLRFMSDHYSVIGVTSPSAAAQEVIANEGIPMGFVPMTRTISPVADLKSLWLMYKLFKKEKPYIVHSHTPKAGTVGMIAAKLAGVPVRLHTVAGLPLLEVSGFKRKILDVVEKITYSCATKVYPNSFGLMDIILKNNYTNPNKLKVIGNGSSNGINLDFFNPQMYDSNFKSEFLKSIRVQNEDFVFIFVGRIVKDKGINELVVAFKNVNLKYKNTKLVLVGRYENELNPIANETALEIKNNLAIIELGFQSEVRPYFFCADALVFPSYREGFPNVVLQAGAMGLPSIVTNINGCNEIIEDQINGLIIPVKDTVALETAMKRLMEDTSGYRKMQEQARPLIVSRYEQQVVWEAILAEYQRLETVITVIQNKSVI